MQLPRRAVAVGATVLLAGVLAQVGPGGLETPAADAAPSRVAPSTGVDVDPRLGNGLGRLVAQSRKGARATGVPGIGGPQGQLAIRDDEGRVLISLTPQAGVDRAAFRRRAVAEGLVVTATDDKVGTLEGYAPLGAMQTLAGLPDTGTIVQEIRPVTHAGDTTSQGVPFQGVDRVLKRGVDGAGVTVGVLSDSFDTATKDASGANPIRTRAADDVATGDLPGAGNPEGDTDPVVVIEDFDSPTSTDEGRGMLQIVHDVAPRARLCFATAFNGDVGFADNIRALADRTGPCRADVIVDDVGYFNEPFYSDGVVSAAVDDVRAAGVSYFSSAGNSGDQNAWRSPVKLTPARAVPAAARRARLDLTGVDPALYAGGLQDMDTGRGTDVAQTLALSPGGGLFDLQWADPVDADGPDLADPFFSDAGTLTAATSAAGVTFPVEIGADQVGQRVFFRTDGVPSGTVDLILDVTTPSGEELGPVDTGASPEVVPTTITEAGTYQVTVSGFGGSTGDFTVEAAQVVAPATTTTDFNVLVFSRAGKFLADFGDDNTLTGQPNEVFELSGSEDAFTKVQVVIAKATPAATPVPEIAYINDGSIFTEEYFTPTAPATYGHPTAAGANGVAAIDPFKPYVNEFYTSPGGALKFYFNRNGQRLANPQTRMKPDVASTDRGNTTFFVADDLRDTDTFPNFGGTSAAAPHAAAIAALMIDGAGGPGSLTPAEVTATMKRTAYEHDLDPFSATGRKSGLTVTAKGAPGDERDATPASMDDPDFFRVSYRGKVPLRNITFDARTASPTALGATPRARSAGLVFDPRALAAPGSYRTGGFPFTIGSTQKLAKGAIRPQFKNRVGKTAYYRALKVSFRSNLRAGRGFTFGVDRDLRYPGLAPQPVEGNGADEIGGGVFLPQGRAVPQGLTFTATKVNGQKIRGRVVNRLGNGFSPVDGYGVVDAYAAVFGP